MLPGTGGTASFKYDPFGRRIQKVFTQGSTTTTTNYAYEGNNSVEDVDQNGNLLARYTDTRNMDEPLAESRSGTTSYYEADGLGSVTSLSSSAGTLANTYTYDSFGKLTASTGSLTNRFQYTAREFDTETNLNYYRARFYDPNVGRFISEDPIRFGPLVAGAVGSANFYSYVADSPGDKVDPSGLLPQGGTQSHDCPEGDPRCQSDQSWLEFHYGTWRNWFVRKTSGDKCQYFCKENCDDAQGNCEWRARYLWCPYLTFNSCANKFYRCDMDRIACYAGCGSKPLSCNGASWVTGPIGTIICMQ